MTDLNLPPLAVADSIPDDAGNWNATSYWRDSVEARERILLARIAELEKDAARYQWLKNRLIVEDITGCACYENCGEQAAVEAAIDRAMLAAAQGVKP